MNGAESLVRSLVAAGVDHVFTNPGSTEMEIIKEFDAVDGVPSGPRPLRRCLHRRSRRIRPNDR